MRYILFIPKEMVLFIGHLLGILQELVLYFVDWVALERAKMRRRRAARYYLKELCRQKDQVLFHAFLALNHNETGLYKALSYTASDIDIEIALVKEHL